MKKVILSLIIAGSGVTLQAQEETAAKTTDAKVEMQASQAAPQQENVVVIEGDGKEESVSLDGGTLIVKGNDIVVHASGQADKIVVEGNGCQVVVDETTAIEIKGEKSYVYYRKGEPQATVSDGSAIQKIDG